MAKAAASTSHRGRHKKERRAVAANAQVSDEAPASTAEPAATADVAPTAAAEPESSVHPAAPSEAEASEEPKDSPSVSVEDCMRQAQRASRKGHHKAAIRKARAVLEAEPEPGHVIQAYQIIAMSSCALGKVDSAREAASHLRKAALAVVKAACKKDGVALK